MSKDFNQMLCQFRRDGNYQAVLKILDAPGQQLGCIDMEELRSWASECQRREEHRASLRALGKRLPVAAESVVADSPNNMAARALLDQAYLMHQAIERFVEGDCLDTDEPLPGGRQLTHR